MAGIEDPLLADAAPPADADGRDTAAARGGDGKEERHGQDGEQQQVSCLPEDLLADVLDRVPPRWLAASRCVCKAWRDAVDGRGLLRADLLPLSFAGFFAHFDEHKFPEFISRPSPAGTRAVSGDISFMCSTITPDSGFYWNNSHEEWTSYVIEDHCNGLILLRSNFVVNPATRRWNTLPPCPLKLVTEIGESYHRYLGKSYHRYLVFDPTVSPHYEVFMVPHLDGGEDINPLGEACEWPPSPCKMYVFSSRSGYWVEKSFVREGDVAGTVAAMRNGWLTCAAVYWRGALYVHYETDFVMRISLLDNKYRMIKPPKDIRSRIESGYAFLDLVRSQEDLASFYKCWLQVWVLNESCGRADWILKHDQDLTPVLSRQRLDRLVPRHWILEDINYNLFRSIRKKKKNLFRSDFLEEDKDDAKQIVEEKFEWNSDNDNALDNGDMVEECNQNKKHCKDIYGFDFDMLGFHPYKEIVFLTKLSETGFAYHLNSLKIECLGQIDPTDYTYFKELANELASIKAFPYTPCWMEEFP